MLAMLLESVGITPDDLNKYKSQLDAAILKINAFEKNQNEMLGLMREMHTAFFNVVPRPQPTAPAIQEAELINTPETPIVINDDGSIDGSSIPKMPLNS